MAPADPELRELIKEMNRSSLISVFRPGSQDTLCPEGEIFPSEVLPAIALNRRGEKTVFPMKWGFLNKGKLLINARVETAAIKLTFRESWFNHRCIIPVSGYFEWLHEEKKINSQKYSLRSETSGLIRLAGIYKSEGNIPSFVILTRPASENLAWMHNRMPLILTPEASEEWIRPNANPSFLAQNFITSISWQQAG